MQKVGTGNMAQLGQTYKIFTVDNVHKYYLAVDTAGKVVLVDPEGTPGSSNSDEHQLWYMVPAADEASGGSSSSNLQQKQKQQQPQQAFVLKNWTKPRNALVVGSIKAADRKLQLVVVLGQEKEGESWTVEDQHQRCYIKRASDPDLVFTAVVTSDCPTVQLRRKRLADATHSCWTIVPAEDVIPGCTADIGASLSPSTMASSGITQLVSSSKRDTIDNITADVAPSLSIGKPNTRKPVKDNSTNRNTSKQNVRDGGKKKP